MTAGTGAPCVCLVHCGISRAYQGRSEPSVGWMDGMNLSSKPRTSSRLSQSRWVPTSLPPFSCLLPSPLAGKCSTPASLQAGHGSVQFSSVAQSCPTLCKPMNHSTPGLPVHHQLPEFTQTHVHRVGDAIQLSHPLSSPSPPAPNPSQHQGLFQ